MTEMNWNEIVRTIRDVNFAKLPNLLETRIISTEVQYDFYDFMDVRVRLKTSNWVRKACAPVFPSGKNPSNPFSTCQLDKKMSIKSIKISARKHISSFRLLLSAKVQKFANVFLEATRFFFCSPVELVSNRAQIDICPEQASAGSYRML